MRIKQETYDQLLILAHLGQAHEEAVPVSAIASRLGMPRQKVQKLAHRLMVAGFLHTTRGRNGGARLLVPASELAIGKLLVALEANGPEQRPDADDGGDQMTALVDSAFRALETALNHHTLADLAPSLGVPER